MKKRQIAVCDRETVYAFRFAEYVNQQTDTLFLLHAFSSCEELLEYTKDHSVEILLLAEEFWEKIPKDSSWTQVFLLTEDVYQKTSDYPGILKYQSVGEIMRQILSQYAERFPEKRIRVYKNERMKRIGVYSPFGCFRKTEFALFLGQELTKKKSVLYLNLEEYSGFEFLYPCENERTLSELLYFLKQGKESFFCKLDGMVQKIGGLDYVPPIKSPLELREIKKADWEKLLEVLEKESRYEVLLLDLSGIVDGVYEILERCDGIYMPVSGNEREQAKLRQYEEFLIMQELCEMKKRTIPFPTEEREELDEFIQQEVKRWLDS